MLFLRLQAVVRTDLTAALQTASDAIGGTGGWIVDHTLFSDVMAVINFSLPADRTGALGRRLAEQGMRVEPVPDEALGSAEQEVFGQLTMMFPAGRGDVKREVPAFH